MTTSLRVGRWGRACCLVMLALGTAVVAAQTAKKKSELPRAAARPASAPVPAPKPPRGGPGWQIGPRPAWVVDVPAAPPSADWSAGGAARRELLVDVQSHYALPRPQHHYHLRSVATDASTLGTVSQPQIGFNPAFQTVVLHEASVLRDGRRVDRLVDAKIELIRREQRLEQQTIDGTETLLVLLNDVRVGEAVEVAYTIEGENPIFEGHIATGMRLAWDQPIEQLHYRVTAPSDRHLNVRAIAGNFTPETFAEEGRQVLRLQRTRVAAIPSEPGTPPWFKVHPALLISDYASWAEVDAWAQRLFALPPVPNPALAEQVASFRASGLTGAALVSEVLRFVQDEIRYFSVSLGESSHRPKPPQRTLAERVGDCKDKVQLLNALLLELGFDAKPALVSMARNRGIAAFEPAHDEFDHVITRLVLDGRTYWLDATMTGQGLSFASRGTFPYGRALVVGGSGDLEIVAPADPATNRLEYEQRWDYAQPGVGVTLTAVMRAHGLLAERWRALLAMNGPERGAEGLIGAHLRMQPGLKVDGPPTVADDRRSNRFELQQRFTLADPGAYVNAAIETEVVAIELFDALSGPAEARRHTPFLYDIPAIIDSRVEVLTPLALTARPPAPAEVLDRHFRLTSRTEIDSTRVVFQRRVERRSDEVLPADLEAFRQNLLRARQQAGNRLRLPLVFLPPLVPEMERVEKLVASGRGFKRDQLGNLMIRNAFARLLATRTLEKLPATSPLAAKVLAARAIAANHLGEFDASLADADAALAIAPALDDAREARGVALLGAGRLGEALAEFGRQAEGPRRTMALKWMASIELLQGRAAESEKLLRAVLDGGGSDDRDYALLWLYLAAERQGEGRGRAAVESQLDAADAKRLPGAMLSYLAGRIDRDAMLRVAREAPDMERLNLAEAYFYIGQQQLAQGHRDEARQWFTRSVETGAVPYREVTLARLELAR